MRDVAGSIVGVVLAAGLGTRMAPFTNSMPKPLLPLLNEPLLVHHVRALDAYGVDAILVNTHHRAPEVEQCLSRVETKAPVVVRREPQLTGPAGALTAFPEAADADQTVVLSADVVCAGSPARLVEAQQRSGAAMTFCSRRTTGASQFGILTIDADGKVLAAREKPPVPDHELHWVSGGVYCLRRDTVARIPALLAELGDVDFARDLAPLLIAEGLEVHSSAEDDYWIDIGNPAALLRANLDALSGCIPWLTLNSAVTTDRAVALVDPSAAVGDGVTFADRVVVGAGATVGDGAHLAECVVLGNTSVPAGTLVYGGLLGWRTDPPPDREE